MGQTKIHFISKNLNLINLPIKEIDAIFEDEGTVTICLSSGLEIIIIFEIYEDLINFRKTFDNWF